VSAAVRKPLVTVDRARAGTLGSAAPITGRVALRKAAAGAAPRGVHLRIFNDHSAMEVFSAEGLNTVTTRVYVEQAHTNGVSLCAGGLDPAAGVVTVENATVFSLNSIW
jgi:sucrose-6-phosphate hydrolase SacC (GH32 family)